MRLIADQTTRVASVLLVVVATFGATGCESLDGRHRNREGNRAFRETRFVDAVAEYEKAITEVDDATIHYNLGLAYSKIFKPGYTKPILLDVKGSFACSTIPQTETLTKKVCLREGDKRFISCEAKKDCPADSYECRDTELCVQSSPTLAALSASHFMTWLKSNPTDNDTAQLMTQVWADSENFKAATEYWEGRLKDKPNDPDIMGILAGISLKADDWRASIDWYRKVAGAAKDDANRLAAYTYIGRVSRAKLATKKLSPADSIEISDLGIGALQKAMDLNPKNPGTFGLMGAIFSLRAVVHGASLAAGIDRATAQDLLRVQGVLILEAKKAQEGAAAPAVPAGNGTVNGSSPTPAGKTGG
jgi:tetratricopeptide (TPR) repeat protein